MLYLTFHFSIRQDVSPLFSFSSKVHVLRRSVLQGGFANVDGCLVETDTDNSVFCFLHCIDLIYIPKDASLYRTFLEILRAEEKLCREEVITMTAE